MPPPTGTRTRTPQLPPPVWDGLAGAPDPLREAGVPGGLLDVQGDALGTGPDAAAPSAPPRLTNPRFVGDRTLERILSGDVDALSASHDGRNGAVGKVQRALVDLGFELPIHEADGSYGAETEEAIRQFRAVHAPPAGTSLDATALLALDRAAPPPGTNVEHTVDYDRLLADGRLSITVAIGHTDYDVVRRDSPDAAWEETTTPVEDLAAERFRAWLRAHTFELELLGLDGEEQWHARRTLTWTGRDGAEQSREVDVWVRLVTPGAGAARAFRQGLTRDEIAIYDGHARYGSGPDFDEKKSAVENFRIGIDRALQDAGRRTRVAEARRHGVAVDEENDLVEMVNSGDFDKERYRVWFFNACTSLAYLDEIREEAGGPDRIDVVGTTAPSSFTRREEAVGLRRAERFLEGLFASESIEAITAGLDDEERTLVDEPHKEGIYATSGFGDNPVAPTASP